MAMFLQGTLIVYYLIVWALKFGLSACIGAVFVFIYKTNGLDRDDVATATVGTYFGSLMVSGSVVFVTLLINSFSDV